MHTFLGFTILLAGCGCSGFSGGGDKVYQRGPEMLILCENDGFVATVSTGTLEGFYQQTNPEGGVATRGDNGQLAFNVVDHIDGAITTAELGATTWQSMSLNQVELDHANIQCTDLQNRTWWRTP